MNRGGTTQKTGRHRGGRDVAPIGRVRICRSVHRRRRHQWGRDRPRCCGPRPQGPARRAGRPRQRHVIGQHQADPWRPALSRILRIPPGARGADRARGAVEGRPPHHLAADDSCCPMYRRCARPGWCGSGCSSTTISAAAKSCRPPAASICAAIPPVQPLRDSYGKAFELHRLLGRRCAAGGAERPRRRRPWRRHPDPHPLHRRAAQWRPLDRHPAERRQRRDAGDHRPGAGQRGGTVGRRFHRHRGRQAQARAPAGQGQPHHRAEAVRSRPQAYIFQNDRPAHRLRDPL